MTDDLLQRALPGYEIDQEIGRGGWGIVYRARQASLGRTVAIKQLPEAFAGDPTALDRFTAEARAISRLEHPHVVDVYDFVEFEGHAFIIMEFVSGGSVWGEFAANGLHSNDACVIALAVASALHAAHQQRVIHRDVKPDNVLLTRSGDARLSDFGNLAGIGFGRAHTTDLIGTPAYMSPEQVAGEPLTPASDVYGLGVMLYELLSGELPFPDTLDRDELLAQRRHHPAPLPEWIAPEMRAAIGKALDPDLAKRFTSAESFGVHIADAANHWFGSDWLRHARGDLLDTGRIAAATRVSDSQPVGDEPKLVAAGGPERERVGTNEALDTERPGEPAPLVPPAPPTKPVAAVPAGAGPAPAAQPLAVPKADPTLNQPIKQADIPPVTTNEAPMTSSPGPPPGTPDPGTPEQSDDPTDRRGTNKPIAALVLVAGVIAFVAVAGFIALVLSAGGSGPSTEYCVTARDLNDAIAQDMDLPLLQAVAVKGEATAPPEIIGAWTQLSGALADLSAPQAQELADEATGAVFNHWAKECN